MSAPSGGYRLLVCGSRSFGESSGGLFEVGDRIDSSPEALSLAATLEGFLASSVRLDVGFEVVHGACPTGADAVAETWCCHRDIEPERHPADWSKGRSAGPERNRRMVRTLDAENPRHLVIAAWDLRSRGTRSTVRFAADAGLPVVIITTPTST